MDKTERSLEVLTCYSMCLQLKVGETTSFEMSDKKNFISLKTRLSRIKKDAGIYIRPQRYLIPNTNKLRVTVTRVEN